MNEFQTNWDDVAPEHRPEKLHGVIDVKGKLIEYDGYRRHWWKLGEKYPSINEPKMVEIWAECEAGKVVAWGASLTEATRRLARQYQHRIIFDTFKKEHPNLMGRDLTAAFWKSPEYEQWANDKDGDSGEPVKTS